MTDGTHPGLANAVRHAANCLCSRCIADRQAEVRRRLEEQRREQARALAAVAYVEEMHGRWKLLGPRKVCPGTLQALAKMSRGGR